MVREELSGVVGARWLAPALRSRMALFPSAVKTWRRSTVAAVRSVGVPHRFAPLAAVVRLSLCSVRCTLQRLYAEAGRPRRPTPPSSGRLQAALEAAAHVER